MKKPNARRPYLLTVKDNVSLTPNMRRVILTGEDLARFPDTAPSAYIKLMFDRFGDPLQSPPEDNDTVLMRTYTVRKINSKSRELHVDMALHAENEQSGPASHWAQHAKTGSKICVGGPGSGKPLFANYDWVVFVGDITSLPAIANYLEVLPEDAKGHAFISVPSRQDIQPLIHPDNVELHWLVNADADETAGNVGSLRPCPGLPAYWVAAEFSVMRRLRKLVTQDMAVPREQVYISSYWHKGRAEDQHKIDKKADNEAFEAALAK